MKSSSDTVVDDAPTVKKKRKHGKPLDPEYQRKWYLKNKEAILLRVKKRYEEKRDEVLAYAKEYRETPENKARIAAYHKKRVADNPEKRAAYALAWHHKKYKSDIEFRIKSVLRGRMRMALQGRVKHSTTMALIGCSMDFLRAYLAERFTEGMSWDNYGEWHIDHIKPCAAFDLTQPAQQVECFHYTNLQPLWAIDNYRKNDTY